jgi:MFS family permease
MDWNDMRDELRKIKAPPMRADPLGSPAAAGDLVQRLKTREAKEQAKLKQSRVLFVVATGLMGFVFAGLCLLPPTPLHALRVLHQGVLLAAFVYITLALRKKLWELSKVDYTRPARSFLEEAERRYVFMSLRDYLVAFVGLLLLGSASAPYVVGLFLSRYVDPRHYPVVVVLYCLFYLLVCALGFYFTYRNWKRDKAPLLEEIRRRENALQEEAGTV